VRTKKLRPNRKRYAKEHKRLRAILAPRVSLGLERCAFCGERIMPGQPWDLGHNSDGVTYNGPEHMGCNRGVAARAERHSRDW
jgi:hypothetical protein